MGESQEFKSINEKLTQFEQKLETSKASSKGKDEEINLNKKKLAQFVESLNERRQRAEDIAKEVLQMEE